jgi:hypothetical protein
MPSVVAVKNYKTGKIETISSEQQPVAWADKQTQQVPNMARRLV